MNQTTPYSLPKEPGRWRAIALAAVVHALLFGLLYVGVRWQNETPVAVEAEIWDPQTRMAAPKPEPVPAPQPVPEPEKKPAPVVKEIPKPAEKPEISKPDIALEQEKKRRQEEKERLAEQDAQRRLAKEKQAKQEQQAQQQKELAEAERKKLLAAEQEKKRLLELDKKKLADQKRKQDEAENKAAEARHQENLARLRAQAGSGGSGEAAKSQGVRADASYIQRVGAKIKSNTVFNVSDALSGNPAVEYSVELLPDGSLRGMRKIKGSGVPGFDEAVARAIEKSQPYPADRSGAVPSGFTVSHRPKDQ